MKIRVATAEDAESIRSIYAPYVEKTAVTFEQERIIGYAYASSFHSRAAYKHAAEVSIYLHEEWHKKGIGKQLYQELENRWIKQNVFILYACVTVT